jgi:DNA polymerase
MVIRRTPSGPPLPAELQTLFGRMAELAAELCPDIPSFVPGVGDPGAKISLVGEAPAEYEVRQGKPFTGPAGRVLNEALAAIGLARDEVWLTNVAKCRVMRVVNGRRENRAPTAGELKAWRPLLLEELQIVGPEVVVCLGATAAKALLGKDIKLTEQRGEWFDGPDGARVIMTFHPAYVLHLQTHAPERSAGAYDTLLADLAAARDRARARPPSPAPEQPSAEPPAL